MLRTRAEVDDDTPAAVTEVEPSTSSADLDKISVAAVTEPKKKEAYSSYDIGTPKPGSIGEDIIKQVKPRDDWWEGGPLSSPLRDTAEMDESSAFDRLIMSSPIASYGYLGSAVFLAIAFVGCIFQLFYDKPAAPVLGVPLTALIFIVSGPSWVLLFVAAIKKGQSEADEDNEYPY